MADHAAYVANQTRLDALRAAGMSAIRAATTPEDLERDDLYKSGTVEVLATA